ncbi:hypothetical protein SAMN04489712_115132 [Thermomonospora echinospora]|uniref:Protein kinase domain-containing protein n=1 Tax=Thermomonospora echinospora TaxID=1992 RepID=A0A1H6DEB6_9ACTN|nr:protein kinase family protein [Thermomonospora echinospora]SEG83053.1 hypothetical protein SAMN04489712_115132 [Thermomonospora echinospora]
MSTSIIEPGTRLSGRYRLEERVGDSGGSTLWKAIDEILARAVAVRTFDPGFPRVTEVVTAARAASRLTDPRLTQVFDADDSGEQAYVVSEWAAGESLEDMLRRAPLEPGRAATLLYEAAEAIAAAHAAGLSHLRLSPRDLLWTTGGTVKLLGVAVDAVLADLRSDDPALDDTRALGRMLYASVTAHWPGDPADSDLPAAPEVDGLCRAARQVQAGVSLALDTIICRALGLPAQGGHEPLTTPADLAAALKSVPRTPLPLFAGPAVGPPPAVVPRPSRPTRPAGPAGPAGQTRPASVPAASPAEPRPPRPQPSSHRAQHNGYAAPHATRPAGIPGGQDRRPVSRTLLAVAAAAVTVIVGISAWALSSGGDDDPGAQGNGTPTPTGTSQPPAPKKLPIKNATGKYEERQAGHPDPTVLKTAGLVHDGKNGTAWQSQSYADPMFGNYLKGLGVVLDMGSVVSIEQIKLNVPDGGAGATLEVRVGNEDARGAMQQIAERSTEAGSFQIEPGKAVRGRYVLLWFTKLPSSNKAQIGEVTVLGRPG